jgi:hypothetical protein
MNYIVYSKEDELIPYAHVEDFISALKKQEKHVESLLLDSPHVQHWLNHREKYENLIQKSIK